MLVLAVVSVILLALAAVGEVCDRWGPEDPCYPAVPVPSRAPEPLLIPDCRPATPRRNRPSTAA